MAKKWKSFQRALAGRVENGSNLLNDKKALEKAVRDVLREEFGRVGECRFKEIFFDFKGKNGGAVKISCQSSIWKSELKLRERSILGKINKYLGNSVARKIVVR